ncbi:hypothetical protein M6B38_126695 [Iris pallida]|uniref:Secreted protein n=1 Tax=Iris pallida TaxID=29817 RepID=A0AAX6GGV0_IRIPA|nr:hypothetical protein M6B38_198470 [Iris pallida]KAJ6827517.1 hypothetical protein M6B38_126695 [Iris pallida]
MARHPMLLPPLCLLPPLFISLLWRGSFAAALCLKTDSKMNQLLSVFDTSPSPPYRTSDYSDAANAIIVTGI